MKTDIETLKPYLKDYLEMTQRPTNKNMSCLSPDHDDQNPSMSFNPKANNVHCFSCNATYDLFDVIGIDYQLESFSEQFNKAIQILKLDLEKLETHEKKITNDSVVTNDSVGNYSTYLAAAKDNLEKTDYLKKRGISKSTYSRFVIGYDPKFNAGNKTWKALIFMTGIDTTSFTARNTNSSAHHNDRYQNRGRVQLFFPQALQQDQSPVFITEGIIDALSVFEAGGLATALNGLGYSTLRRLIDNNELKAPHLILALDQDEAGHRARKEIEQLLKDKKIPYSNFDLENTEKDLNEALMKNKDTFVKKIKEKETQVMAKKTPKQSSPEVKPTEPTFVPGKKIPIQFSKTMVVSQRQVELKKYNPEEGKYEPVLNDQGKEVYQTETKIKMPSNSQYTGYLFTTTDKLFEPHRFDKEGTDLGSNEKLWMFKVRENVEYKLTKTPYVEMDGQRKLDFANQVTVKVTGTQLKEEFESWKEKSKQPSQLEAMKAKEPTSKKTVGEQPLEQDR